MVFRIDDDGAGLLARRVGNDRTQELRIDDGQFYRRDGKAVATLRRIEAGIAAGHRGRQRRDGRLRLYIRLFGLRRLLLGGWRDIEWRRGPVRLQIRVSEYQTGQQKNGVATLRRRGRRR